MAARKRQGKAAEAAGTATVLDADTLEPGAKLALGATPASFALAPDGRALLVALGGAGPDRGDTTASSPVIPRPSQPPSPRAPDPAP